MDDLKKQCTVGRTIYYIRVDGLSLFHDLFEDEIARVYDDEDGRFHVETKYYDATLYCDVDSAKKLTPDLIEKFTKQKRLINLNT